jgi:hypothetical protein
LNHKDELLHICLSPYYLSALPTESPANESLLESPERSITQQPAGPSSDSPSPYEQSLAQPGKQPATKQPSEVAVKEQHLETTVKEQPATEQSSGAAIKEQHPDTHQVLTQQLTDPLPFNFGTQLLVASAVLVGMAVMWAIMRNR